MAARQWTTEQKQCIEADGGPLLVSAAAGSGKTAVLVQRILHKITREENPVSIDRLLVVTFTKAAAAEMKQRIGSRTFPPDGRASRGPAAAAAARPSPPRSHQHGR